MNPFEEKIRQLRAGEIDQIEVSRDDFFLFREAWIKQEDKKFFRGIAGLKGNITYVYDTTIDFLMSARYHEKGSARRCWNWQTSMTKDHVRAISCGFESHSPHEGCTRQWCILFLHLKRYVIIISLYPVQLHSILLLI